MNEPVTEPKSVLANVNQEDKYCRNKHVSLSDIQKDWRLLDDLDRLDIARTRMISHQTFTQWTGRDVHYIEPSTQVKSLRFCKFLYNCAYARQLLKACDKDSVLIVNGGSEVWLYVGIVNRLLFRVRRKVLCWDVFVEVNEKWKRRVVSVATKGMTLLVLWSRKQIVPHAKFLGMPMDQFVFIPYKANHSKGPQYDLSIGRFIFSGGNGKRDYASLVEAVRGTGIPVVISATDPDVRKTIEPLPNVIVIAAQEPAFAQLQAACEFVVIPMINTGLKGGGEANFCNAMWHGKPVIAADDMAADDYIVDGQTGFIVPSGDISVLRRRIVQLWNNPEQVKSMGSAARRHVEASLTHEQFIRRLLRLVQLLGEPSQVKGD